MIEQLHRFNVSDFDIEKLKNFKSRDGFILLDNEEFSQVLDWYKEESPIYDDIIPIMSDNQSNYCCLYVTGPMKGMICYFDHDEASLEPVFKNIANFVSAIENNPNLYNFFDFQENGIFDNIYEDGVAREIVAQLLIDFKAEADEVRRSQLAFSIMALTPIDEIETIIYPFLDDSDMWIQERAIEMLGFHQYKPAKEKLIELQTTAMPNGRTAAKRALEEIEN